MIFEGAENKPDTFSPVMITRSRRRGAQTANLLNSVSLKSMFSRDYAVLKWIKNRLSPDATADEAQETQDETEESVAAVGVRVRPPEARDEKPADTYVAGYNVDEDGFGVDDEHSTTVNDIKTTGVDPYDTGYIAVSDAEKSVPEK